MIAHSELTDAYETCRLVTKEHARTFYFASFFLNRTKRNACYAVYAFCRYIDDLIDDQAASGPIDEAATTRLIQRWRSELDKVYDGGESRMPVMVAWADILTRYDIPREWPDLLIEGCMSDLRSTVRYENFEQLYGYCYNVASVVGLMTGRIFGYEHPEAEAKAVDLGIAMQLTNILRDVGEDLATDRIYLPREELERFGISEQDLREKRISPEFIEFMRYQIDRARHYYRSANRGIPMLESDSRMTVWLMSHNYSRILDAIERNDYNVFTIRARVSLRKKLMSLPTLWLRSRREQPDPATINAGICTNVQCENS